MHLLRTKSVSRVNSPPGTARACPVDDRRRNPGSFDTTPQIEHKARAFTSMRFGTKPQRRYFQRPTHGREVIDDEKD
jgi:hypothetical protein